MPIPDTLARKITADFGIMGAEKIFVTLWSGYTGPVSLGDGQQYIQSSTGDTRAPLTTVI